MHARLLPEMSTRADRAKAKRHGPDISGVDDPGVSQVLPTPSGLAESFLETEPKEEKEELQAAISSRSQVLQRTISSLSTYEDEELGLGSETLSLPSFVAAFLKGVADRLRLKIKDISVRLDMEMKQDGPSKRQPEDKLDLVAGLLTVREVEVHGVSGITAGPDEALPLQEGKRLISLVDLNVSLVSESAVFSNYSRFAAPVSPTTTMHSKSQPSSRVSSPSPLASSRSKPALAMTQSTLFEPPRDFGSQGLAEHRMEASAVSNEGRFSDADSEFQNRDEGRAGDSQIFENDDPFHDNPGYLDSVIDTQLDDFDMEQSPMTQPPEERMLEGWGTPRHKSPSLHASGSMARGGDVEHSKISRSSHSFHTSRVDDSWHGHQVESEGNEIAPSPRSVEDRNGSYFQSGSDIPNADLAESKYFSHDEAQSLYMSAISQNTGGSLVPDMPGAWGSVHTTAAGASENRATQTAPVDKTAQDEAIASTPKLASPSNLCLADPQTPNETQAQSQSVLTDKVSTGSSPTFHKDTEMRKPIFNIDKILVWVPSSTPEEEVLDNSSPGLPRERADSDTMDFAAGSRDSALEESLLASKFYAQTKFRRGSIESRVSSEAEPRTLDPSAKFQSNFGSQQHGLALEVFSITIRLDIATGWLLAKICQRLLHVFSGLEDGQSKKQPASDQSFHQTASSLVVHGVSVKFIEHVTGHSSSSVSAGEHLPPSHTPIEDIILQLTVSGLEARLSVERTVSKFQVDISKFAFGFASDNLISFDETLKMRESTRDILAPSQGDISLSLTKSADSVKVNLSTLLLHLNLNIERLEDVLGWMGGLSTILELGNSISSAAAAKGGQAIAKKRHRGVHFEPQAPLSTTDEARDACAPWKVNARVGGIVLDVVGETHYLKLNTSAVKIVSRFQGVGVQIDKVKLGGPLRLDDPRNAPAKVTLNNVRTEYLFSPKEVDLDRLLTLITPSKDKYDEDDDIMLDTLLRQRRQGAVLRITVAGMKTVVSNTGGLAPLSSLDFELSRLSNVTKYLPDDDRPGILTLTLIRELESRVHVNDAVGDINMQLVNAEIAYINIPSLVAAQVGTMKVNRNEDEELVGEAVLPSKNPSQIQTRLPVLMARFIPDEMDPTFKVKLHHLRVEYTLPSVTAFFGLDGEKTSGDFANDMVNSIVDLTELQPSHTARAMAHPSGKPEMSKSPPKPTKLAVVFRDCVLGLSPRNSSARGLAILTNAKFAGSIDDEETSEATLDIRKASLMIIDDMRNVGNADYPHPRSSAVSQSSSQVQAYIDQGYVPVSSISSATAVMQLMRLDEDDTKSLDVELRDDLLILETCADSTQTLISIINGLQPPTLPNATVKYRTEVMPLQDMLASFSGDAFSAGPTPPAAEPTIDFDESVQPDNLQAELEYVSDFYPVQRGSSGEPVDVTAEPGLENLLESFHSQYQVSSSITELDFQDDHFAKQSAVGGTAHRWDSTHNTYGLSNDPKLRRSPLRVRVRDVHLIWNLFDGYDWQRTRDTISKAVKDVETKATERRARASRMSPGVEDEEESVIGDFLFNSIYIGIPANKDPHELHREINRDIDDLASETGSYATSTTVTGATSRQARSSSMKGKRLRLQRSKHHKMTFELKGVSADLVVFPPDSEETQSSLDVRVSDLEIFDHVPTSTWKKFATYMHEAGEKESGTSMIHLEVLTVKPVPELAASEIVLKVCFPVLYSD